MPINYVKKLAKEHNITVEKAEERWNVAKKTAAKQGKEDNYAYITSIFKKMMNESLYASLKDYMILSERDNKTYDRAPSGDRDEFEFGSTDTEEMDDEDFDDEDMDSEDFDDEDLDDEDLDDEDMDSEDFDDERGDIEPPDFDDEDLDDEDFDDERNYGDDERGDIEPPELDDEDFDDEDLDDEDFDDEDLDDEDLDDEDLDSEDLDDERNYDDDEDFDSEDPRIQRLSSNEGYRPLSLLRDLLNEGKKTKSLKRIAKSVYHRDYLKTKSSPYRKYHKNSDNVSEGMWDYAKGAGQQVANTAKQISQPIRDIHAAGQQSSRTSDLTNTTLKLAKAIALYRQTKKRMSQTNEGVYEGKFEYDKKTGQMGLKKKDDDSDRYGLHIDGKLKRTVFGKSAADNLKKRDPKFKDATIKKLDEGMWDYVKGAGQQAANTVKQVSRDVHTAGQQSSLKGDLDKYQRISLKLFDQMLQLIDQIGPNSPKIVAAALKNTPNGIRLAIYNKLKKMQNNR